MSRCYPRDVADDEHDDPDRAAILARRRRFLAVALSGVAATALAGCETTPAPCLRLAIDAGAETQDAGPDAASSSDAGADASPMPCLAPEP